MWDVEGYVSWLYRQQLADSTIKDYRSYATRWANWAATRNGDPHRPTRHDVRAWSNTLPPGVSSRDMARGALRQLCLWRQLDPDIASAVARPQKNTRNRRMPLPRHEAAALMDWATRHPGDQGTVVMLGLTLGMRISEIIHLRWEHIDWDAGVVTWWRPKNRDWHTVGLPDRLADRLRPLEPEHGGAVVAAANGGRRCDRTVRRWVVTAGETCGLQRRLLPHDLRRTAGRAVYEACGRDITVPQAFLGHRDPAKTALYIRADLDRVLEAVRAVDYFDVVDDMPAAA